MSIIYSFLQKRKMHENQHGIVMVVTAYVLSVVMLVLGSDAFYNINSAAAEINIDKIEEAQEIFNKELPGLKTVDFSTQILQSNVINPYGLYETKPIATTTAVQVSTKENSLQSSNSIWLLGRAMDIEEFDNLLVQMNILGTISSKIAATDTTADSTQTKEKDTVESFSTKETGSSIYSNASKEEVKMLERIVEAEATGEDMKGKILIANVIFNRMAAKEFPDTIEEVIFQESKGDYQFSPVSDKRYWSVKITDKTKKAVQRALEGEDYSEGALYFIARKRTSSSSAKWFDQRLDWLFKHGGHEFYKNK